MLLIGMLMPLVKIIHPSNLMLDLWFIYFFLILMLFYRPVKPAAEPAIENVPISVRKMSDHQFPSLSLIDHNKINGFVITKYLITIK